MPKKQEPSGERDASAHTEDISTTFTESMLMTSPGVDRLDADVRELFTLYEAKKDVRAFLTGLPMYSHATDNATDLDSVMHEYEIAVRNLLKNQVNSTAAMKVRQYIGDCVPYPLMVLLEALARANGIPQVFYVDVLLSVMSSAVNKESYVKLTRFKSRSRHWMNGTANVGEGKSAGMRELFKLMEDAMRENAACTVGFPNDRFQYQQSGTTAGAVNKLRTCDGYLCVYCSDAGRCLSDATAQGKKADPGQFIDLEFFLDAAHGDEFDHTTFKDREKAFKTSAKNPSDPKLEAPLLHLSPTNVEVAFLCQNLYFMDWWARVAVQKPIGIPQRCMLSFGGDADPAPASLADFPDDVVFPILKRLFVLQLRSIGPKIVGGSAPVFSCTPSQDKVAEECQELNIMFKRGVGISHVIKEYLSKASYWLGTVLMLNHLVKRLLPSAIREGVPQATEKATTLTPTISDACFVASLKMVYNKYVYGQCVLAKTAEEEAWLGRHVEPVGYTQDDLTPLLLHILRASAAASITEDFLLTVNLELKRALRLPTENPSYVAARELIGRIFNALKSRMLGQLSKDEKGRFLFRKGHIEHLSAGAVKWLRDNRVPLFQFGVGKPRDEQPEADLQKDSSPWPFSGSSRHPGSIPLLTCLQHSHASRLAC